MKTIVVITTPGNAKKYLVNTLQKETGGAIALVCLQRIPKKNFWKRFVSFYRKVGLWKLPREIYCFLALKLSARKKKLLSALSARMLVAGANEAYDAPVINVDDINAMKVRDALHKIHPDLLVIWGGRIVKRHILETARRSINMHFGICPFYRGVNGVHHAILYGDLGNIGVTIHYAVPEVDAGKIISIITADSGRPLYDCFKELNDAAVRMYIDIAKRLLLGEAVPSCVPDASQGKTYVLREWTYEKEYTLAKKLAEWSARSR